jgi:DNA-binding PadR family transcriptional regulator
MTTQSELALLSLLAEQPYHGYELEHVIESRGMREWTEIGFSSIYYLLKKLEGDGWIESRLEEAGRGPARKVYSITEGGREQLRAAILEALTAPQRCYTPLLLGIANLPAVSAAEAAAALRQYVTALDAQLAHMRERWEAQKPLPYFVEAMFAYSDTLIQTERDWIEQFITQVEAQHGQG